jgi:NADH-quinone oxidoreductase subunit K
MGISFGYVLALSGIVVVLGMICAVARRNLIMILLGVEVMLNGAAIAFIGAALRWQHLEGQAFVLFIIAIAAAEVSLGLALIVYLYHRTGSLDPQDYKALR